jgi:hypothetical protein
MSSGFSLKEEPKRPHLQSGPKPLTMILYLKKDTCNNLMEFSVACANLPGPDRFFCFTVRLKRSERQDANS